MSDEQSQGPLNNKSAASVLASVWSISGGMIGCSLFGFFIGRKMGDATMGTLVGASVGLIYVGYMIWLAIKQSSDVDRHP